MVNRRLRLLLVTAALSIGLITGLQPNFVESQSANPIVAKAAEPADGVIQDPQLARLIRETPLATGQTTFYGLDGPLNFKNTIDSTKPLTPENLENLENIYVPKDSASPQIDSLEGLQYAKNLKYISFLNQTDHMSSTNDGQITSLAPLKDLPHLQIIQLPQEAITDITPIKQLSSLKYVELSNQKNEMDGSLDHTNWPNLVALTAVNNNLSGSLNSLSSAPMQDLTLTNNRVTGTIPDAEWRNMLSFVAPNNQLTGPLPKTWSRMYNFVAQNNQLTGTLPSEWGHNAIYLVNIANNRLSGPVPLAWSNIRSFNNLPIQIDTSQNQLTSSLNLAGHRYTSRNQTFDAPKQWTWSGTTASLKLSDQWLGTLDAGKYVHQLDAVTQLATTYRAPLPHFTDATSQPGFYWNVTPPDVLRDDSSDNGRNVTFTGKDGRTHNLADLIKLVRDGANNYRFTIDTRQIPARTTIPFNIHFADLYRADPVAPVFASSVIKTSLTAKRDTETTETTNPTDNTEVQEPDRPTVLEPSESGNGLLAGERAAVYARKPIYLYRQATFKKSARIATYVKKPRVYRPMFVVLDYARSRNGALRYRVKDVNHHSKTAGKVGYITAKTSYVRAVYYQKQHATLTVINPKGINEYRRANLTGRVKHLKQGTVLKVKKIVTHNLTTRYVLPNGHYITGNRKLVFAGRQKQPQRIQLKRATGVYYDLNFRQKRKVLPKGTVLTTTGYDFSQKTSMTQTGTKRYVVASGYLTANHHTIKIMK
ncbi:DUF5776 domain-containing protein [Levilactobacillus namurensis]|uniref:DUF5776 domain-containing protein n=1 Tax=Levilactobacillus namurensis TaxID=380393 RepID=UPI0004675018|nr:DUF5776 domain-containing protein [Levilactobacillus namurensis]